MPRHRFLSSLSSGAPCALAALVVCFGAPLPAIDFEQVTFPSGWDGNPYDGWDSRPSWSPRGDRLAYQDYYVGGPPWWELIANFGIAQPGRPGQLVWPECWYNEHASWAPDGARLAFQCYGGISIYSLEARTTTFVVAAQQPHWSPDGRWIAYPGYAGGQHDIYLVPPEGGAATRLSRDGHPKRDLAWSPDGARLAYAGFVESNWEIFVVAAAGGAPVRLTDDPAVDDDPAWSPDATTLAFVSTRGAQADIWFVPSTGGAARRIAAPAAQRSQPEWSPDGKAICYVGAPGERAATRRPDIEGRQAPASLGGLLVYSFKGERETLVTDDASEPTWSPDGRMIAFTSTRSGTSAIWIASDLPDFSTPVDKTSWGSVKSVFR